MTPLRLISNSPLDPTPPIPRSPASAWRISLLALEYWQHACDRAHRAMIEAPLGQLLEAVDALRVVQEKLAAAQRRERRARFVARGERWLKGVVSG
jgi:hypothetical protein